MISRPTLVLCVALVASVAQAKPAVSILAPATAAVGDVVTLESDVTDRGTGDLSYLWHQAGGVPVRLTTPTERSTTFTVPATAAGTRLVFELIISDPLSSSDPASATISIAGSTQPNTAPIAVPGGPMTVIAGASVTLDGSGSHDPDNESLIYSWQQIAGADKAILTGADTPRVTLTAPKTVTRTEALTIRLTVTDPQGATGSATVTVTVEPRGCGCQAGSPVLMSSMLGLLLLSRRRRVPGCSSIPIAGSLTLRARLRLRLLRARHSRAPRPTR